MVTIPRGREDDVVLHSVQVSTANHGEADLLRSVAEQLIVERLQRAGHDAPMHLGEIQIGDPDLAV